MKKTVLLSLFIINFMLLSAQNQNNNWYFGDSAGISFNTVPPTTLTNGVLSTWEGCASISDAAGDILFYTDGTTVYNKQHDTMANGDNLFGNWSSTQGAVIVPLPMRGTIYYIFTIGSTIDPPINVCYSIVDMSVNGGLGKVVTKNYQILETATEKACIIKHANSRDYWLVFHDWDNNDFHAFLLDSNGLDTNSVITSIGCRHYYNNLNAIGCMKVNQNCDMIAVALQGTNVFELFDFDNSTGVLSNAITINEPYPYGIEFSSNGQLVYVSSEFVNKVVQYDISTYVDTVISNSRVVIANVNNASHFGALQLGPDNKIYFSIVFQPHLSVINYPNNQGTACNFVRDAIFLDGNLSIYGLPNLVYLHHYSSTFFDTTLCIGEEINFYGQIITTAGSYYKHFINVYNCDSTIQLNVEFIDCSTKLHFPNVFTPNNDGYNDMFYPIFENIGEYKLVIYNKWGTPVFTTHNLTEAWDGKNLGIDCSAGVYYWIAVFSNDKGQKKVKERLRGTVDIVRE